MTNPIIRTMIAIVITLAASVTTAHAQLAFLNEKNQVIGKISAAGKVIDPQGQALGNITPDGKVIDPQGRALGAINADGSITNARNATIGKTSNGKTIGENNQSLFQISSDGKVINPQNKVIATIKGDARNIADKTTLGKTAGKTTLANDDIKNLWASAFFIFFDKTNMAKTIKPTNP